MSHKPNIHPSGLLNNSSQTNNFKSALAQAKEFAINLPGGELCIKEQDDVIYMLETLRDRKR